MCQPCRLDGARLVRSIPKESECKEPSKKPAMNSVDTEEHFGACRTGQGLTDGKYLLVLETG